MIKKTIFSLMATGHRGHKIMKNQLIKPFLFFLFFLIIISNSPIMAFEDEFEEQSDAASYENRPGLNPGAWLVSIFKEHISAVDSDRCPSIPSCSSYCVKAIKKHGFFIGWIMTVDRLIHEGSEETRSSPIVYSKGKWKIYDPVENNDFWWYHPKNREHHE